MASSSEEEGSVPFDKFASATRVSELLSLIMKNKATPRALAAARAEALSLSQALGRNAARMEQEDSSVENPPVAAVPLPARNKVPLATIDDALAAGKAFYGDLTMPAVEEKPEKRKKYRRVRLSKADLEYILSYKSSPLPHPPASFLTEEKFILDCYPVPRSRSWTTSH